MAWQCPTKYLVNLPENINDKFLNELKGELTDKEARITLAQFMAANIGMTSEILTGGDVKMAPFQEILAKGVLRRNFSMFVLGRGCGKSLYVSESQQLIEKSIGRTDVLELSKNLDFSKGEYVAKIPELSLWNGDSWQPTNKVLVQPQKDCARVTTRMGYFVEGSINHKIKVLDSIKCEIVWKRYHELDVEKDYICIDKGEPEYNNDNIDEDESYLIGLIIGDGCITQNSYSIVSNDEEILSFCEKYPVSKRHNKQKTTAKTLKFKTEFCNTLRDKYEFNREKSYFKKIPKRILRSKLALKNFLSGIFDTDGWVSLDRKTVSFCTVSDTLVKQVHISLLTFGIISKIRSVKTQSPFGRAWIIDVSGENEVQFFEKIGFRLTRKQSFYQEIKKTKRNTNLNIIPGALPKIQSLKGKLKFTGEKARRWNFEIRKKYSQQKNISRDHFNKSLSFFRDYSIEIPQNLLEVESSNFFFDKITSITKFKGDCIDFCDIPNGESYWCNGFINHNSYIASQLAWLIPLFEPNTNIIIAGPTFRTARLIFSYLEKTVMGKNSGLLKQIFADPSKRPDLFEWKVVGNTCISTIRAIPLNGEKIRGFRANVLILDEFLLLSEDIVKNVLMPFLVAPSDIADRMRVREAEDEKIKLGEMTESEREVFENKTRMIALTSASFTFENAFKVYSEWLENIMDDTKPVVDAKYFVARMGFEALPTYMIDKTVIEEAASGGKDSPSFLREYCARFIDGSDSYFSAKKMHEQTIKVGDAPVIKLTGDRDKEYILSIDPSWSSAPNSDYFAICILEINKNDTISVVHNYAVAGGDLVDHIRYFLYLLMSFNIVLIIADNADGNFIQAANESSVFKERNINLGFIDYDGDLQGEDFDKMVKEVRKQYNLTSKKICFKHVFNQGSIRRINEQLQNFINTKKIWFASSITPNEDEYKRVSSISIPYEFKIKDGIFELISDQDDLMPQLKKQCSLIEVKSSPTGGQVFDLPANLKRDKSINRARKDNYTALMLGVEGFVAYNNIMRQAAAVKPSMFSPVMYGQSTA